MKCTVQFWPAAVVSLLLMNVGIVGATVAAAMSGGGAPSEPDYYKKAVGWDDIARQRDANTALGWRATATFVPSGDGVALHVRILDMAGAPIQGASVEVEVFHNARSRERRTVTLRPAGDGYQLELPVALAGAWVVRGKVAAAGRLFTFENEAILTAAR